MSGHGQVGVQVVVNVVVGRMVGWKNLDEVGTEDASIRWLPEAGQGEEA